MNCRLFAAAMTICVVAFHLQASELSLSVIHDPVVVQTPKLTQHDVVFTDVDVIAELTLDVFEIPGWPSTFESADELRRLTLESWLNEVRWTLASEDDRVATLVPQRTIINKRRDPSSIPSSPSMTYTARVSFGRLDPGDYKLSATVFKLTSSFRFSVRTGREPQYRDAYLEIRAAKTSDYSKFRRMQLERLDLDPYKVDASVALFDRSLVEGTLDETVADVARLIALVDRYRTTTADASEKRRTSATLSEYRRIMEALPAYHQSRGGVLIVRDVRTGHYVMRDRGTQRIVKEFADSHP